MNKSLSPQQEGQVKEKFPHALHRDRVDLTENLDRVGCPFQESVR